MGTERQMSTSTNGTRMPIKFTDISARKFLHVEKDQREPSTLVTSPEWRKGEPYTLGLKTKEWRVMEQCRYSGYRSPKPHAVVACLAHVCTTDTNQGLATHELRAIVNFMVIRTLHRPFRGCQIHPILVLSYLGYRKARIIQAVYDGQRLTLQYSQLWTFKDEETTPVEMFVRYLLSKPISLEVSTTNKVNPMVNREEG
ncbi:hypothetical protein N7455_008986 [Penicillium solitum]|uniref:uncharacterized protein n=1 Tax=Penicillium solitum TaxID=60172 RepID=UPI0032C452C8|nr:hypothetical protein N7455_008986 [Penicillium solitum]